MFLERRAVWKDPAWAHGLHEDVVGNVVVRDWIDLHLAARDAPRDRCLLVDVGRGTGGLLSAAKVHLMHRNACPTSKEMNEMKRKKKVIGK